MVKGVEYVCTDISLDISWWQINSIVSSQLLQQICSPNHRPHMGLLTHAGSWVFMGNKVVCSNSFSLQKVEVEVVSKMLSEAKGLHGCYDKALCYDRAKAHALPLIPKLFFG